MNSEEQAAETCGGQEQDQHDHRDHVAHHHAVKSGPAEMLPVFLQPRHMIHLGPTTQPMRMLVSRLMKGIRKLLLM